MYIPIRSRQHAALSRIQSTDMYAESPGADMHHHIATPLAMAITDTHADAVSTDLQDHSKLPSAIVVFVSDYGVGRQLELDKAVSRSLNNAGIATLLLDLLTPEEVALGSNFVHMDTETLSCRLSKVLQWLKVRDRGPCLAARDRHSVPVNTQHMDIGLFATGAGASTAIAACARCSNLAGECVRALVSLNGKFQGVEDQLKEVQCSTLLMATEGENDSVLQHNTSVFYKLRSLPIEHKQLDVLKCKPSRYSTASDCKTHEQQHLETVQHHAREWFQMHLLSTAGDK